MKPTLTRLSTGYIKLSWNAEQWAQWPCDREPVPDDCFNESFTWPLVRDYWALRPQGVSSAGLATASMTAAMSLSLPTGANRKHGG